MHWEFHGCTNYPEPTSRQGPGASFRWENGVTGSARDQGKTQSSLLPLRLRKIPRRKRNTQLQGRLKIISPTVAPNAILPVLDNFLSRNVWLQAVFGVVCLTKVALRAGHKHKHRARHNITMIINTRTTKANLEVFLCLRFNVHSLNRKWKYWGKQTVLSNWTFVVQNRGDNFLVSKRRLNIFMLMFLRRI